MSSRHPAHGHAEARALLVGEGDHRERPGRAHAAPLQRGDGEQRADDAERAVVRPAGRHAVEVAAGHDGARAGRAPPGPEVAVAVGLDVQAEPLRPARRNQARSSASTGVQADRS